MPSLGNRQPVAIDGLAIAFFSVTSHIYLHSSHTLAIVLLQLYPYPCPLFVRYLFDICSILIRFFIEHVSNKHWTSIEHEWELLTCSILATLANISSIGDVPLIDMRLSVLKPWTQRTVQNIAISREKTTLSV